MLWPVSRYVLCGLFLCGSVLAEQVREQVHEFSVGERPRLSFELPAGAVELVAGEAGVVKVRTRLSLADVEAKRAERVLDVWGFAFEETPHGVRMVGSKRKAVVWDWDPLRNVQVNIEITAPAESDLRIDLTDGSVVIGELHGDADVRLGSGSVFARRITGGARVRGERGLITFGAVEGGVDIAVTSGEIVIGRAEGPVTVSSQGGSVEIQQARDTVRATGSGVDLLVGLTGEARDGSDLNTSGGSVTLKLERDADLVIDARASLFGEVKVRGLPLEVLAGGVGSSRLQARVNAGGPRINLRASGGNVSLIGLEPLVATVP